MAISFLSFFPRFQSEAKPFLGLDDFRFCGFGCWPSFHVSAEALWHPLPFLLLQPWQPPGTFWWKSSDATSKGYRHCQWTSWDFYKWPCKWRSLGPGPLHRPQSTARQPNIANRSPMVRAVVIPIYRYQTLLHSTWHSIYAPSKESADFVLVCNTNVWCVRILKSTDLQASVMTSYIQVP